MLCTYLPSTATFDVGIAEHPEQHRHVLEALRIFTFKASSLRALVREIWNLTILYGPENESAGLSIIWGAKFKEKARQ